MSTRHTHPGRQTPGPALTWLCVAVLASHAAAQSEAPPASDPPTQTDDASTEGAKFVWVLREDEPEDTESEPQDPADTEQGLTLDADLEAANSPSDQADDSAADAWLLSNLTMPSPDAGLDAAFQFRALNPTLTNGRADLWARSIYANDASALTPFVSGQRVFGWDVTDSVSLAGVGSRRVITDRNRGFIFSAEAGFQLAPNAGFQLGYELLQASAGTSNTDLGADSLFARFQLRF